MLTVRINGLHNDVVIFECATVIRGDAVIVLQSEEEKKRQPSFGFMEFYDSKNEKCAEPAHYGMVYVMNSAGKTVAKYDLGGWELPHPPM